MLGIKGNEAEEFVKANIVVKTIRIEANGKNKESVSFPPFKFKELAEETWEDSTIFNYFDTTKFLFVSFRKKDDCYVVDNAKLWNMPYEDLNIIVRDEWQQIHDTIINGVIFTPTSKGMENNLLGISDSKILHVRPHAQKAAYKLHDGTIIGNVERDADELPNGEYMTKQSFWLKSSYVLKQIK